MNDEFVVSAVFSASDGVAAIATFVVVYLCADLGLRNAGMFGRLGRFVMCTCTALLCVIALMCSPGLTTMSSVDVVREATAPKSNPTINAVLIPWAALALTFVLLPLLLGLVVIVLRLKRTWAGRSRMTDRSLQETENGDAVQRVERGDDPNKIRSGE